MKIPDALRCLFSAQVQEHDESYVVEVPDQELQLGNIRLDETYRVAVMPSSVDRENDVPDSQPDREHGPPTPPVKEGDQRDVEIVDIGEQGDGIARVERGFVIIVPDTVQGERVTVEITDVAQTVAFGKVIEREDSQT